ncbi:hypothetical protein F5X96DRAFT_655495, partial [Biscogniauxia mediterranea]
MAILSLTSYGRSDGEFIITLSLKNRTKARLKYLDPPTTYSPLETLNLLQSLYPYYYYRKLLGGEDFGDRNVYILLPNPGILLIDTISPLDGLKRQSAQKRRMARAIKSSGLVIDESECMEVDNACSSQSDAKLDEEQLKAEVRSIYGALCLLPCQLPSAMSALHRPASDYSMMTLLYETVPVFEDAWIECLGDLGRYRYVITT